MTYTLHLVRVLSGEQFETRLCVCSVSFVPQATIFVSGPAITVLAADLDGDSDMDDGDEEEKEEADSDDFEDDDDDDGPAYKKKELEIK